MQSRIAMVNTGLTCLGMYLLAIPGIGLQSLFVFICSFIPIAGCFISTIPIAFVALTEYGFFQVCCRPAWAFIGHSCCSIRVKGLCCQLLCPGVLLHS